MIHKVILADNQSVFRTGAARILAIEEDFRIIGQCDDQARLFKAMTTSSNATVLFAASLNVDLAALVSTAEEAGARTVVILENDTSPQSYSQAGVRGILHRDVSNTDLLRCMRLVGRGERYVQQRAAVKTAAFETDLVAERVRERLTPKELKVVALILQGYKNRDIAEELHNSEQVIKNYLRSIFDKTGVSDRLELALFAMHHKLLTTAPARTPMHDESAARVAV
ncbi:response regulator transcription factor [Granulicella tundricola]|uniref:Transcriptional regulator, LuxR family n=1 Tax=Granulicella tundricola (strain ATCC BAA-1859 / DSM 23138 / MP5ACTX9) TaxID=1198114 RepID=E8WY02_GRATM|nr:response regulator transcription factor [Granulicella tundricola]ADW67541.1 transcriptional regulator, LuxR family [Granulicella tundricola MP5ACTX9]